MAFALMLLLTTGCIAFVLARPGHPGPRPDGLRGRIRATIVVIEVPRTLPSAKTSTC